MSSPTIFPSVFLLIIVAAMVILSSTSIEGVTTEDHFVYASPSNTSTLPGFNFAAAGDWGCTSHTTDTVNNIVDKNPQLVLGLGDYEYYGDDADCWLEIVEPIDDKMKIAIGNHEVEEESKLTQYMEYFGLSNQYYSFDYQNVHFTVMSDYVSDEIDSEQYTFVQNDLAKAAAADPNVDWIVIVHHDQEYASTANNLLSRANKWKEAYHPLFEQYNVDLVLQGHQHNYQRTYPIKYDSDTPINPIITDRNRSNYTNPEGQIFATVGTAGASLHNLNGNKAPYLITAQDEVYGFLNVDVTTNNNGGTTVLVGTFYSNDDDDASGEMTDQFTITKSAEGNLSLRPSPPPHLPVEEETDYRPEEGNDNVENADEPDNGSEGANDEATESEGGIADEEEAIASDEEGDGDGGEE
jgi:calcineurin-like phosphoesterase family protein